MTRRVWVIGAVVVIAVAAVGGYLIANRPPTVPAGAASTALDRTVMTGGHGARCLDRLNLGSGWADVCWAVDRFPDASDNTQDYYQLRVYGSFQSLSWLVARADLVGEPDSRAYVIWPEFPIEGSCHQVSIHLGPAPGVEPTEPVCGRTVGELDTDGWAQRLTWTCEQCLLPDDATKPLAMYASVAVPAGTTPAWDVFVDGGR